MTDTDPVVKALLRERYGQNSWWKTPRSNQPVTHDDDLDTARRRRQLAAAWSEDAKEETA